MSFSDWDLDGIDDAAEFAIFGGIFLLVAVLWVSIIFYKEYKEDVDAKRLGKILEVESCDKEECSIFVVFDGDRLRFPVTFSLYSTRDPVAVNRQVRCNEKAKRCYLIPKGKTHGNW